MKIGIIGALKKETKIIKKIIKIHTEKKKNGFCKTYVGSFQENDIFLIESGIGKVSASIATTILINLYKPDIIINSGSAGSLNPVLKIGDIILPNKTCYYDVNLTNFGYAQGQVPEYPAKFMINKEVYNILNYKNIQDQIKFTTGLIISGDTFIRKKSHIKKLKNQFHSAVAVEMELTSIAQVCYQFQIPLIVVKSISDLSDNNATSNFKKNISIASCQSSRVVKIILENIYKI